MQAGAFYVREKAPLRNPLLSFPTLGRVEGQNMQCKGVPWPIQTKQAALPGRHRHGARRN
ncbi:hypothetical protein AA15237_3170 [Komagataeibacter xylinus NBRC 15237]|nr:hypothetical protein AA15237_3170 [Komagataeibacter xylinus NBRC 15237]